MCTVVGRTSSRRALKLESISFAGVMDIQPRERMDDITSRLGQAAAKDEDDCRSGASTRDSVRLGRGAGAGAAWKPRRHFSEPKPSSLFTHPLACCESQPRPHTMPLKPRITLYYDV